MSQPFPFYPRHTADPICKKALTSLGLTTIAQDGEMKLPKYDEKVGMIGDGTNMLSAETKNGVIVIKQ